MVNVSSAATSRPDEVVRLVSNVWIEFHQHSNHKVSLVYLHRADEPLGVNILRNFRSASIAMQMHMKFRTAHLRAVSKPLLPNALITKAPAR